MLEINNVGELIKLEFFIIYNLEVFGLLVVETFSN